MRVPKKIWDEWKLEGYETQVFEPRIDYDHRTVWVETEMNFVLPFGAAQKREEEMSSHTLDQDLVVRFTFKYKDLVQPPDLYIPRLVAEFIYRWRKVYSPAISSVNPENVLVEGHEVKINTRGEFFASILNKEAGPALERMIGAATGQPFHVNFIPSHDVSAKGGKIGNNLVYIYSPHKFEHKHILEEDRNSLFEQVRMDEFRSESDQLRKKLKAICECRAKNGKAKKAESPSESESAPPAGKIEEKAGRDELSEERDLGRECSAESAPAVKEPVYRQVEDREKAGTDSDKKADVKKERPKQKLAYPIFGRLPNTKLITNIEDVRVRRNSKQTIVVEGTVFDLDIEPVSSQYGKHIVLKIWIHDAGGAILAKKQYKEDQWKEIPKHQRERLRKGAYIRLSGIPYLDADLNYMVCLKVNGAAEMKKQTRSDSCDEKRVELHAHTKMSAKDALNDVEDLIRTAARWGHPAVAITDHGGVQTFPEAAQVAGSLEAEGMPIKVLYGVEGYLFRDEAANMSGDDWDLSSVRNDHIIILAKNKQGLKNLYKLISKSHLDYFYKKPLMPRTLINEYREGLIIGSACEAGELFRAIVAGRTDEDLLQIGDFYDYLEIQPLINNRYLIRENMAQDEEELKDFNRKVVDLGEKLGKPVVATCDTHYMEPGDAIYRRILLAAQNYKDLGEGGLYFRTTDEMLEEFSYLGEEKAREVVIENTRKIADQIEKIKPIPEGKYPPEIEGADEILRTSCYSKAKEVYGDPLPYEIKERLDAELDAVIGEGYAVMYVSAQMLVDKAREDGYVVGSRGSVGSSLAATMAGITEVNPLPPHYICPECKYIEWGDLKEYDCGVDMPAKQCPKCGADLNRDGYHIPFETFLGNENSRKEPDIDLNFPGEYQETAQKYVNEIFGANNVYKAGTITTIQGKTAFGYAKHYEEVEANPKSTYALVKKNAHYCEGVRTSSGQHPGGIIVLPEGMEIEDFCPVQRPAGDRDAKFITTHFDYHAIDTNLLKLDVLGHDVPSIIRHLYDMTGVDPMTVPLQDKRVQNLFLGRRSLKLKPRKGKKERIIDRGTFGIPEFGTDFVRKMLKTTKPDCMGDLIRISGFSHGTNVWTNNAENFIKEKKASMKDAISTRDDIMNYLEQKGMSSQQAFKIMEKVRKGRGLTAEEEAEMKKLKVPNWYIESCKLIQYLFPKAHAVAYVSMAYRIGYFKVYHPAAFYAAHLTTKVDNFRWDIIKKGVDEVEKALEHIYSIPKRNRKQTDEAERSVLEVCYEMYRRGIEFLPPSIDGSDPVSFDIREKDGQLAVVVPISGISRIGTGKARKLKSAYDDKAFTTIEDVVRRGGVDKTSLEILREEGFFTDLPETEQIGFAELG